MKQHCSFLFLLAIAIEGASLAYAVSTVAAEVNSPAPIVSATSITPLKILAPAPQTVLNDPATTVVVQSSQNTAVELRVNGIVVPTSLIGRTETDPITRVVTQTYYGVALKPGSNILSVQAIADQTIAPTSIEIQVRGTATQLKLETVESRIPADGRSTGTIRGQLLDDRGNRSNQDAIVTVVANAGDWIGEDFDRDQPGFQVKARGGEFVTPLRSGLEAKTATIRATTGSLEAFTSLEFQTDLRPSIATGVIDLRLGKRGTDYFDRFQAFLPSDRDNHYRIDVRSAAFATGRVGGWRFTGAFNTDRTLNQSCDDTNPLFRVSQPCDQNYPVYGDTSQSYVLAPSTDSLFLRFERTSPIANAGTDYAMWGDYNTDEFASRSQEFTATTRQLHGLKANYNLGNLQITGFYGNNVKGFQRDAIAPDGTSGYYFLSRRLLVEGSEDIFIELEELNRPGTIVQRKRLVRGLEYEIDYDRGTVLFREPILRTDLAQDGTTLTRRIVATYQYDTPGHNNSIYAGRLRYHFERSLSQERWLGATYLRENQGMRDFELYGTDIFYSLGSKAQFIAEYAHASNTSDILGLVNGSAYRVELAGEIWRGIQGRAFYRQADTGFVNNATLSFVPGQTRYGAQVTAQLGSTTDLRFQYDHEDNRGTPRRPLTTIEDLLTPRTDPIPGNSVDNSLTTISAGIQQKLGAAALTVDWLHRQRVDRQIPAALNTTSDQLRTRLTSPLTNTLSFLAQNETTLSSQVDAVFPDRTTLGLNWAMLPGINLQLAQQFFTRGQFSGQSLRSLNLTGDYNVFADTKLSGRIGVFEGDRGITTQGAIGISQGVTLFPGLKLDLAYEHVFGDLFGNTASGTQFLQPFAPGQSSASLGIQGGDSYSVGVSYTDHVNFQANARYERRSSSSETNTVIIGGATGKISSALTALVRYQQASSSNQILSGLGSTANLKVGLAYRDPKNDQLNALLRYEYRKNPATIPDTLLLGNGTGATEHLFALEAIYAPTWQWEFYGKFALRNGTSYLASDLIGTSTVTLTQARATYRFDRRWDIVGEARWIAQPNAGYSETGCVIEAGYYLTPNLRASAGYVFGRVGDRDFDNVRSSNGFYFGLTVKLNDLFNGFGLQKVPPPQALVSTRDREKVLSSPTAFVP